MDHANDSTAAHGYRNWEVLDRRWQASRVSDATHRARAATGLLNGSAASVNRLERRPGKIDPVPPTRRSDGGTAVTLLYSDRRLAPGRAFA
jgi:hypothetical protein